MAVAVAVAAVVDLSPRVIVAAHVNGNATVAVNATIEDQGSRLG